MASPSYGIDVVGLAFAIILAPALAFLLTQLVPQIADWDDAAALERCTLGSWSAHDRVIPAQLVRPTLESTMQAEDFKERGKGLGVAAVVVLSALIEWLCVSKQLSRDDLNLIFEDAEDRLTGDLNVIRDARIVIAMIEKPVGRMAGAGQLQPAPNSAA